MMDTKNTNDDYVPAVRIRNVCFSYQESTPVLKNVNMQIPVASIYGLLGPSGCGKTTLLKCIVNCVIPQSGNVFCFGHKLPSNKIRIPGPAVGYMPQEISLYEDLKVGEFLRYFAKLNLMKEPQLTKRFNEIIEMIELKERVDDIMKHLSGGQKRRVSFAATLLHKPLLAILDEPTVGVDPILRHKIWNHLNMISKRDSMTILITTHYIEEAGNADVIAFMRKGIIIAENSPKALISLSMGNTLEDVFLHFCHKRTPVNVEESKQAKSLTFNNENKVKSLTINNNEYSLTSNEIKNKVETDRRSSLTISEWIYVFTILYWKFHTRYMRNPSVIVFFFLFPLAVVIFSSICIGKSSFDMPLGVVNMEAPENFSVHFLKSISDGHTIVLRDYETIKEAMKAAKSGEIWGFLHIKEYFSDSLIARKSLDNDVSNETIEESVIRIYADVTNEATTISIMNHLYRCYTKFVRTILELHGLNPSLAELPIVIDEVIYGHQSAELLNREFLVCGVLVLVTYVSNCSFIAAVLILERDTNMFERHFVAGVSTTQIFTASFAHKLFIIAVQTVCLIIAILTLYDFDWHWNVFWAIIILFLGQVSGLTAGLLFSTVFDQLYNLAIFIAAFSLMTLCIGGVAWPLESIPYWMRWVSDLQPTSLPSIAMRSVLMKKFGIESKDVQYSILLSLSYIVICFLLGNKLFRYTK